MAEKKEDKTGEEIMNEEVQDLPLEEQSDEENLESVMGQSWQEKALTLEAEAAKFKAQADEYYAHLQRLQAEFDNFRKRTQKEKEELTKYASERVVEAMLPVLDNFERAMGSAKTNRDFDSFAQGVDMIFRQFQNVLTKEGLAVIEAVGQPFDPNMHEAVLQIDSEEHTENTVVEELQKGYTLKDKLLRPSMVKVSR